AVSRRMKELALEAERVRPGTEAAVSEMFTGRRYVLFVYDIIKDIRLVYVPPRSIGEFGGDQENWQWPRHTGDFSFVRAYVAPDGTPAEYSPSNIPFTPKRILRINPAGAGVEETVFVLGYPGRTYRHRTSSFLSYEQHTRMPYVRGWYGFQIRVMEEIARSEPSAALILAPRRKSLANTLKNYGGKLQGLTRLDLLGRWRAEEHRLQKYILDDEGRRQRYESVQDDIRRIYSEMENSAPYDLTLRYLKSSVPLDIALSLYEAAFEFQKPDLDRISAYMEKNKRKTLHSLLRALHKYHAGADSLILREMLIRASRLPAGNRIYPLDAITGGTDTLASINTFLHRAFGKTILLDDSILAQLYGVAPERLDSLEDPFLDVAALLYPLFQTRREVARERNGKLMDLQARLLDAKQHVKGDHFIPDANSTLRLTYGRVRGYSPADGIYAVPRTTLRGLVEKSTGLAPFDTPESVLRLWRRQVFGRYADPVLGDVPVCMLYNLDTAGGNSGSAVMNARGELVGLNFDRTYEATINDFAWSEEYSRSIGVDIRYILWVTDVVAGAGHLMKEMGITH
ncbi:MAG: S46 family peptidase, partial [Ignavibacteria bacterium]|nr:S46 family peptidase [Ignavibacteria bacterium]